MQGIWVVLGLFLFPSVVFAQTEISLKADNVRAPISQVACETNGADLFVVVGDPNLKVNPSLTLLLRNYATVVQNTQAPLVKYTINDATVGAVSLIDSGHHWRVYNSPAITSDSKCDVQVAPVGAGALEINLTCTKLSLLTKALTLDDKQKRMIDVVSLSTPVRCVPQRRN
jgi:hypothetical protein